MTVLCRGETTRNAQPGDHVSITGVSFTWYINSNICVNSQVTYSFYAVQGKQSKLADKQIKFSKASNKVLKL